MEHNFRTLLPREKFPFSITHTTPLIVLGSCFAQHIGELLMEGGFATMQNPFGITYNPLSLLEQLAGGIRTEACFEKNGQYMHYSCHGFLTSSSKDMLQETIATKQHELQTTLKLPMACTILTFGTSSIYELYGTSTIVNNCHKQPDYMFQRRMLRVEEIVAPYIQFLHGHLGHFPEHRFIFTVSPIRHMRDGLHRNTISKATLHLAVEEILRSFPEHCVYFPSYELLMDDLRDYRFYEEDMLHPSKAAISYIWDYFTEGFFTPETKKHYKEITEYVRFARHRVLHPETDEHRKYQSKKEAMKQHLYDHFPFLREQAFFRTL